MKTLNNSEAELAVKMSEAAIFASNTQKAASSTKSLIAETSTKADSLATLEAELLERQISQDCRLTEINELNAKAQIEMSALQQRKQEVDLDLQQRTREVVEREEAVNALEASIEAAKEQIDVMLVDIEAKQAEATRRETDAVEAQKIADQHRLTMEEKSAVTAELQAEAEAQNEAARLLAESAKTKEVEALGRLASVVRGDEELAAQRSDVEELRSHLAETESFVSNVISLISITCQNPQKTPDILVAPRDDLEKVASTVTSGLARLVALTQSAVDRESAAQAEEAAALTIASRAEEDCAASKALRASAEQGLEEIALREEAVLQKEDELVSLKAELEKSRSDIMNLQGLLEVKTKDLESQQNSLLERINSNSATEMTAQKAISDKQLECTQVEERARALLEEANTRVEMAQQEEASSTLKMNECLMIIEDSERIKREAAERLVLFGIIIYTTFF